MTDQEIARRLAYVHQTLELIALLLAILVASQGGVGLFIGAGAIVLLVVNIVARVLSSPYRESVSE